MAVNNVVLVGRLSTDVKVNNINENVKQAKFSIAVDRRYKRRGADKPDTDFIKISVIGAGANFAERYYKKGKQVSIVGSIETYSYEHEGRTIYDFCVRAEQLGFADSANGNTNSQGNDNNDNSDGDLPGFAAPPAGFEDDDLPF